MKTVNRVLAMLFPLCMMVSLALMDAVVIQATDAESLSSSDTTEMVVTHTDEDYCPTLSYTTSSSEIKAPVLTLNYPSLSFEDEIFYNVYYTVDDSSQITEMGLATFATRDATGTIATAQEIIPGYMSSGGAYMVRSNGIPAKNLGDMLYFKVYAKLSDGSYVYSDIAGYHAVAYANTILNNPDSSTMAKSLVVAMLNYGAAAQAYFGYNTDNLMNASLTIEQQALVKPYDPTMVADVVKTDPAKAGPFVMNGGYANIWPTVSFEGAFSINFYFTPNMAVGTTPVLYYWDAETYNSVSTLTYNNATGKITMTKEGDSYGAAIGGIAAKDMDKTVHVAGVYTSNGVPRPTSILSYSLGQYSKTIAANGEAFGAATAVYGYYAKDYFASYQYPTVTDGVYRIKNANAGLYLGTGGGTAENTSVELLPYAADGLALVQQLWSVRSLDNGYYAIRPIHKPDMALHISSDNVDITTVGTTDLYSFLPDDNRWTIISTSRGYRINHPGAGSLTMGATFPEIEVISGTSNGFTWLFEKLTPPASSDYLLNVEFSFDYGAVDKFGTSDTLSRSILNRNFLSAANAFAQKCGIYLVNHQGEIAPYSSDADNCPTASNYLNKCTCTTNCLLRFNDNVLANNSDAGFRKSSHCKSITRLRNNLIVGIPDNTIRVTYTGHTICYYSSSGTHKWNSVGALSDYDYPIIAIKNSPTNSSYSPSTLAHEISHLFGVLHHDYDENNPCIMSYDAERAWFDADDVDTYWCSDCIEQIISQKSKYSSS